MDFKQIEAFVNVVRYKSFSKAADATFFTQPTISTHISTLEKELGTKLLDRKGRTVEMTPKGRDFYKYAIEMVNTRARAIEAIDKNSDQIEGVLEIQTSTIPGITFLPEMISRFRKEHERTQFYVEVSDSEAVVANLFERQGEIGFVGQLGNEPNLEYTKIFSDPVVLVTPASMDLGSSTAKLEDIASLPLIWRESGSATRKSFEEMAASSGFDKNTFDVVAKFNDLDMILRAVEEGLGVSILSESTVAKCGSGRIRSYRIEGMNDKRDFYMIAQKGVFLSPVADAFRKFVIENVKD